MELPWLLGNIPLIVARLQNKDYRPDTYINYWNILPDDIIYKIIRKAVLLEFMEKQKNFKLKFEQISEACIDISDYYNLNTFDINQLNSNNYTDNLILTKRGGIEILNKDYKYGLLYTKITCKQLNTALKINKVVGRTKFKKKKEKIQALMKI